MTLPTLLGVDDTIGPALSNIAGALQKALQPHKETEIELRQAIAKNPKVAEQLADMEYNNPGLTGKIFGENVQSFASSLAPSVEAKIGRVRNEALDAALKDPTQKEYIEGGLLGFRKSDVLQEQELGAQLKSMSELLSANPQLRQDANFTKLFGKTQGEYDVAQANANAFRQAQFFLENGAAGLTPMQLVDSIMGDTVIGPDGKPFKANANEIGALFNSPVHSGLYKTIFQERMSDKRFAIQEKLAGARDMNSFLRSITTTKVARAVSRATEVEGETSPAAMAAAMYGINDPSVVALGGVSDSKAAGYADFLAKVDKASAAIKKESQLKDAQRTRVAQNNVSQAQAALAKMEKAGAADDAMIAQVAVINNALEEAGALSGTEVRAAWTLDPTRFFAGTPFDFIKNKGIYYFDKDGNPLEESSVETYVATGKGGVIKKKPKVPGANAIGDGKGGKAQEEKPAAVSTLPIPRADTSKVVIKPPENKLNITAKEIFPNAKNPQLVAQVDRIASLENKNDRKKYYDQILEQNKGTLSEDQKNKLKTLMRI